MHALLTAHCLPPWRPFFLAGDSSFMSASQFTTIKLYRDCLRLADYISTRVSRELPLLLLTRELQSNKPLLPHTHTY